MGCASSTPMIATAGSEMLKAATHVASDATKSAEDAVQDVTHTLGKTIDTAKETVGTAVTGFANDLGQAIKEKTDALDEAKNTLLEKLHVGTASAAGEQLQKEVTMESVKLASEEKTVVSEDEIDMEQRTSRAPTPAHDVDSLRTTTPEPEIEQALANIDEESPPTPKPTLAELEKLTTEVVSTTVTTTITAQAAATKKDDKKDENDDDDKDKEDEEKEEGTTTANEATAPPAEESAVEYRDYGEQRRPNTTEWEKYADMLAHNRKMNPYEVGAFRRGNSRIQYLGPPGTTLGVMTATNPIYREYTRPMAVVHRLRDDDSSMSDQNYNSYSSPIHSTRSSPRISRPRFTRAFGAAAAHSKYVPSKKYQRDFVSLVGGPPSERVIGGLRPPAKFPIGGRKFDFNPNRSRITSPKSYTRSRLASPIMLRTLSRPNSPPLKVISGQHEQLPQTVLNSPAKVPIASPLRTSRSSTNTSLIIPSSISPSHARSPISFVMNASGKLTTHSRCQSPSHYNGGLLSPPSETADVLPIAAVKSPVRVLNTSSFLSSPRCSPFSVRKSYSEYNDNKENKAVFVADLSSVTERRSSLTPSPYKIRERCAVCYNKYVIN